MKECKQREITWKSLIDQIDTNLVKDAIRCVYDHNTIFLKQSFLKSNTKQRSNVTFIFQNKLAKLYF